MGILQAPSVLPGQVGVLGALKYMVTTDSIGTITTAGYLNNIDLAVYPILSTDVIATQYSFNLQTNKGTFSIFTVSISNGVITLVDWSNPGDVLLPVVNNHFANFNGTSGQIKDAGYLPSDPTLTIVSMVATPTIVNNIAYFDDTNGSIANKPGPGGGSAVTNLGDIYAGASGSNGAFRSYPTTANTGWLALLGESNNGNFSGAISNLPLGQASTWSLPDPGQGQARILVGASATPFITGNFPVASGSSGLMVDSGLSAINIQNKTNIKANSVSWAGGGTSNGFTIAGLTSSSIVIPAIQAQATGTVYIVSYIVTANTLTVTFSADPGAMVLQYVAFIATQ
jgi:hypothetical protein